VTTPALDPAAWLLAEGRLLGNLPLVLEGTCWQLDARGLQLARVSVQSRALHPQVQVKHYVFAPHEHEAFIGPAALPGEVTLHDLSHGKVWEVARWYGSFESEAFQQSPLQRIAAGEDELRLPIDAAAASFPHPVLADLRERGCTDYVAFALVSVDGARNGVSYATRKPGGFTEADLQLLRALNAPLALCVDVHAERQVTRSLVRTYLGAEPGERVLAGHIRRGDVETVDAAIWFSDIRGFTVRSAALSAPQLVNWLNAYFGAIAPAIEEQGGEILKFIGDAVLAVFPVTSARPAAEACRAALRAARSANQSLDALNQTVAEPYAHGIALHLGPVQYGNIGAQHRLDFTVIGPAVNLASRVEGLCSRLGRRTLATQAVAELSGEALEEAGEFELKGISQPERIFVVA
jgi:adenylate cyclase